MKDCDFLFVIFLFDYFSEWEIEDFTESGFTKPSLPQKYGCGYSGSTGFEMIVVKKIGFMRTLIQRISVFIRDHRASFFVATQH
jgi:hypothetical protein